MILVTGASGHLGTLITRRLAVADVPFLAGSRSPEAFGEAGRHLDFDDDQLDLAGTRVVLLISAGYAEDDVVTDRHERLIAAAEQQGVDQIVYTSLTGAGDHLAFAAAHRWTERRLRTSSLRWTILRNGLYAELLGQLAAPTDGLISTPLGSGALAAVAREDLAEAAAAVLLAPADHAGRTYELVGPEAISAHALADAVGAVYEPKTMAAARSELANADLLPFQPPMLMSIYSAIAGGFLGDTQSDLPDLLGRSPRDALAVAAGAAAAVA